ncbi:leucine--tRNA ligase, partial [Candidatus Uhrbacteria bacterium]|nr:leucine--tRNA ligase [Candidatus Uhrbacteria bacterium]
MNYDHKKIERKWQQKWERDRAHEVTEDTSQQKEKMYVLDMFPYPSAQGLHVGHPEGYTATDIVSRYFRMRGKHVLHPMGWDAFGLPAENYAIKTKAHPHELTQKNIATFKRQIQSLGFSYDWSREVDTSSLAYYRWTQWLFLQLYKKGLAYKKKAPVNWCPSCQTVLANEQVVDGACERCHTAVEQKELEQWFFKITDYVERLLADLEGLDWPERIKEMQRNWIGKSEGAVIRFAVRSPLNVRGGEGELTIDVFTSRADTLFSAAFIVLAPAHPLLTSIVTEEYRNAVDAYIQSTKGKTERDRTGEKDKTGIFTGAYAVNPANGKEIPIWVGDFVLMGYGTGAVFGDAHDERDFEFAKQYKIPLTISLRPKDDALWEKVKNFKTCFTEEGILVHSEQFNGLTSAEGRKQIVAWLQAKGFASPKTHYKIRDWLVSRQRYWGAPIPIIYCDACGAVPVPEKDLPVELPTDVDFLPTGESPLARSKSFHNVICPKCGAKARRESDTMDTFVDSSWYFLRYCDPKNEKEFADKKKVAYWSPVDLYVGGAEHAVLHLLYARFITKVLADFGYINFQEPFLKLRNQGMILGEDGQKMSKSRGNVINPDEVVEQYGADTMRLYEM